MFKNTGISAGRFGQLFLVNPAVLPKLATFSHNEFYNYTLL